MNTRVKRNILRVLHLLSAVVIGTYIYSPWRQLEWFTLLNQFFIVPLLTISGLWMWKGHKIKHLFSGHNKLSNTH